MEYSRAEFENTTSHWDQTRDGWGPGVRHITFHLTFEDATALRELATRFAAAVDGLAEVDVVPPEWLHLTMTGLGLASDLDEGRITGAVEQVFGHALAADSDPLAFARLRLVPTGVLLAADEVPWLTDLKRLQEEAAAVHGTHPDRHQAGEFRPHVTLAYFDGRVDVDELERRIRGMDLGDIVVPAPTLALIDLQREGHLYSWRSIAERRLAEPPALS